MSLPILWHFPFSHYAEKARWALDFKGVAHVRRALVPGLHYPRVWWATRQATVPVLILDGKPIADSSRIIAALEAYQPEPSLYPRDPEQRRRALALEDFFDEECGHDLRRAFMYEFMAGANRGRDEGAAVFASGQGAGVRRLLRASWPVMQRFLAWRFHVGADGAERSRARIRAALDRVEAERRAGPYLVGDRFTVADLTAAALLFPLVSPPEFPYRVPLRRPPGPFWDALGEHPALGWVRETYRRHRGTSVEAGT
jgi:glutathione S-transferase